MRAVVTGASGHLGSHLVAALCEQGHSVLAVVRQSSDLWRLNTFPSDRLRLLRSEIGNLQASDLRDFAPDVMFHLAWAGITSDNRDSANLILTNIENSLAAFTIATEAGCTAWIGVGSQAEYGHYGQILQENSSCAPTGVYGASKVAARQLIQTLCYSKGIRFVWFRLFATYGPMDDPRHLIPSVIDSFLRGQSPSLTPGEQIWDYLFVRDAAAALMMAGTENHIDGTFNLASGTPVSIRDLVNHIHGVIAPPCGFRLGSIPYSKNQIMHLQADTTKWRTASGWEPSTHLSEGLSETIDWHKARKVLNS